MSKVEKVEDLGDYIEYLKEFVRVMTLLADAAEEECIEDDAFEIEAPCRAAVHHVTKVLHVFLSVRNSEMSEEAVKPTMLRIVRRK